MTQRIPVNPGNVEWSGDNPAIYLRESADGPWTCLAAYFNVVYSPHGRGRVMIMLGDPARAEGYPRARNACITDNAALAEYLVRDFVSLFPSFRGQPGLGAMTRYSSGSFREAGDMATCWQHTAAASNLELTLRWRELGAPFAVEVGPEHCATGRHDMYSVFLEAGGASVLMNDQALDGRVTDRIFFGRRMSTAFIALSETWVSPAN